MTIKELIQAELERVPEERLEQVYNLIREFNKKTNEEASDWDSLGNLLEECKVETGISDLSYQHDHYLHGTPKQEEVYSINQTVFIQRRRMLRNLCKPIDVYG